MYLNTDHDHVASDLYLHIIYNHPSISLDEFILSVQPVSLNNLTASPPQGEDLSVVTPIHTAQHSTSFDS